MQIYNDHSGYPADLVIRMQIVLTKSSHRSGDQFLMLQIFNVHDDQFTMPIMMIKLLRQFGDHDDH